MVRIREAKDYLLSKLWPVVIGAGAMGGVWLYNAPPSNVIAPSPDRIIPSSVERKMANGALKPDLFEVRTCNVDSKNYGVYQTMFIVYNTEEDKVRDENGVMLLASVVEGSPVFTPYEGQEWRCKRPRF